MMHGMLVQTQNKEKRLHNSKNTPIASYAFLPSSGMTTSPTYIEVLARAQIPNILYSLLQQEDSDG